MHLLSVQFLKCSSCDLAVAQCRYVQFSFVHALICLANFLPSAQHDEAGQVQFLH